MQWKHCICAAREPRCAQPVSWLWSLLGGITLQIIPLGIIAIERNDLVFNKEKLAWPEEAKSHTGKALLDYGRAPLASCVKKC